MNGLHTNSNYIERIRAFQEGLVFTKSASHGSDYGRCHWSGELVSPLNCSVFQPYLTQKQRDSGNSLSSKYVPYCRSLYLQYDFRQDKVAEDGSGTMSLAKYVFEKQNVLSTLAKRDYSTRAVEHKALRLPRYQFALCADVGYIGNAGVTVALPQGTPASGGRPPIKGAVMFLRREDLNTEDPYHASRLFNKGDKVHIPVGSTQVEQRRILGNEHVNGEGGEDFTISGAWEVVDVGATEPDIYFMTDNTRDTPGGENHVHTSSGTDYGIQGAEFHNIWPWSAGAGSVTVGT